MELTADRRLRDDSPRPAVRLLEAAIRALRRAKILEPARGQLPVTLAVLAALACPPAGVQAQDLAIERGSDRVVLKIGDQSVATYVFRDAQVNRPYWAHIRTPRGIQVSRHHPPQEGVDATDHAGLHAGIWMSFGDLSGQDYWRMKAAHRACSFCRRAASGQRGRGVHRAQSLRCECRRVGHRGRRVWLFGGLPARRLPVDMAFTVQATGR